MSRRTNRQRVSKAKPDPVMVRAREIGFPELQIVNGSFQRCGVANRTDADQRHTVRSKETTTLRRRTHLEQLKDRGVIDQRQLALCEWYFRVHEEGFGTTCHISNYGGAGGSAPGAMDLLAKTRAQFIAREEYRLARASISPMLINLFERVVIGQTHIGDGETWRRKSALKHTFRLAVDQLDRACGHLASGE